MVTAAALLACVTVATAHPGHGSDLFVGTLKAATDETITIEFRDMTAMQLRRVNILLTEDTTFRIGKEPIESLDGMIGAHAAVAVDHEEGPTGEVTYRAREIRFRKPKNKDKDQPR